MSLAIPITRRVFELVIPQGIVLGMIALGVGVALVVLTILRVRPRFEQPPRGLRERSGSDT